MMHNRMQMTDSQSVDAHWARPRHGRHGHVCQAETAFARLTIGARSYDVADASDGSDLLAFRADGQGEWTALDRRVADGWVEIGADILLLDPDVMFDFLQTHAVRLSTSEGPVTEMRFDTMGLPWSARLLDNRDGEVSIADGEWHYARLGLRAPNDARARAILLLLAAVPDLRTRFEPHVSLWARRIAKGLSVAPCT